MVSTIDRHRNENADRGVIWLAGLGGLATGYLTPLMEYPLVQLDVAGRYGFVVAGLPFIVLVVALVRGLRAPPLWIQGAAAVVTAAAFLAAIRVTGLMVDTPLSASGAVRNLLAGMAGGFTGAAVMALGFLVLRLGRAGLGQWLPMVAAATLAGGLLAADLALRLDSLSLLFMLWQASVAATLVRALRT
jgi:hypothetical protein